MPELPEIETVKRTLTPLICGATIQSCRIIRPEVIKHPAPGDFALLLRGQRIASAGRRGKYLLLNLTGGDTLIAHLRMTGRMLCAPPEHALPLHTHVVFELDNGCELRFADTRRFGGLWLQRAGETDDFSGKQRLGPEPFDACFGADYLKARLGKRRITIKQGILDQAVVAGLGNIYADEALYLAGIAPDRRTDSISYAEWQAMAAAIIPVLESAIAHNGTTFSDYLDGAGREGQNLPYLQVYRRTGQPCRHCGTAIARIKVGGRSSHYCPVCQK
ncbi:MAG: bifunctional DNA-formamidopyrimidine glycosylase/DNA-(apurinic or apyrimidinic site) lyase [Clostridia bacterium]|nr:bifunctional DNA-formamidopyrimidine glycosylase/DNA-(apurinic or apyrimidinic site) lyase [Clostridia bacterium]